MDTLDATWLRDLDSSTARAWPAGWSVQVVEATGSTNSDLLEAAAAGAPDRSVLVAAHQTAGRGRLDRRWDAPPGANLLVSVLRRDVGPHVHGHVQRVALAARAAVEGLTGVRASLKWPNDLLVDSRKLAGVLAQSGVRDGAIDHVVVGIGVNVGWCPPEAAMVGHGVHPLDLLDRLLVEYDRLPDDLHDDYRHHLATLGQQVRVERPGGDVVGRAIDVEADGRLVVIDECAITHRIDTGDVIHLRPA